MDREPSEARLEQIAEQISEELSPLFLQAIAAEKDPKKIERLIRAELARILDKLEDPSGAAK